MTAMLEARATPVGEPLFGIWLDERRCGRPGWYTFGREFEWAGTREQAEKLLASFDEDPFLGKRSAQMRVLEVERVVETRDGCGHLVERRIFAEETS